MFEKMYVSNENDKQPFGTHWCLSDNTPLEHGKNTLIAVYKKNPKDGDGQHVEVYCIAVPSRFYTIKVLDGINSINKSKMSYSLSTGSSMEQLTADLAKAISEGMIGLTNVLC